MNATAINEQLDFNEAQARLDAIPGSSNNQFKRNTWFFALEDGNTVIIDFNDLQSMNEKHPCWSLASEVDWVQLSKIIWLSLDAVKSPGNYIVELGNIKLLWSAMAHLELVAITRENYQSVLTFLLMHGWRKNVASRNSTIKSYSVFHKQLHLSKYRLELSKLGLDWISRDLTDSFIKKQLQELIPIVTNGRLTYHDWRIGGSNDQLGLDYGCYYVEHCITFFEKNYPLAIALNSTFQAIPELAKHSTYSLNTFNLFANKLLSGWSPEELNKKHSHWCITTIDNIRNELKVHFIKAMRTALFEYAIIQDDMLHKFAKEVGLNPNSENIDRLRVILWDWVHYKDKRQTLNLLKECQTPIAWATFQNTLTTMRKQCNRNVCQMPTKSTYKTIGLIESKNKNPANTYPRQLMRLVSGAGLTTTVALTGWRKSEFGFPCSSIRRTRNNDKLDQYAFPWRYQVDWYVQKTHAKVKLRREITFNIYALAERLHSLNNATHEQPCLYPITKNKKNPYDSRANVHNSVHSLWGNFVLHYAGFKLLDDWTTWKQLNTKITNGKTLTLKENQESSRLMELRSDDEWSNLAIEVNLKEARQRARKELPRLQLLFSEKSSKDKKTWLLDYRNRTLRTDWQALLDEHLSDDTKNWLFELPETDLISAHSSRVVMDDLNDDTSYPTPHSFRHMWAEAIYRRFDGDIGWMIRSQFKHISRSMWLAYIRNKDNRQIHQQAKEQVISSLVRNYIKHKGKGYAGQLHTWLRRLSSKTTVASPSEQERIIKHLTTVEIENIKANPWGYCLLKRRTRNKAKCSVSGEPMRHNASPNLCLGCSHNFMKRENVEWSLLHIATHVETLKNPLVPNIFKKISYELIKQVAKHVRTLDQYHEALLELGEVLKNYNTKANI